MADTPEALVYEQALRGIDEQRKRVDDLRGRASTLLAAAAIVTSFLGAEALRDVTVTGGKDVIPVSGLDLWEVIAIACFVCLGAASLRVIWPHTKGWKFLLDTRGLIDWYVDGARPLSQMHRELAEDMAGYYEFNSRALSRLYRYFELGILFLGLELIAWILDIY